MKERNLLLGLSLGSFHTALLMVVLVILLHNADNLRSTLDDLSTAAGIGLFSLLWTVTTYCTWRAVCAVWSHAEPPRFFDDRAVIEGMLWGGWAGGGFFALFVLLGTPLATLSEGAPADIGAVIFTIIFVGSIGSMIAFGVGATIGLVVALIDCCILEVARAVTGVREVPMTGPAPKRAEP